MLSFSLDVHKESISAAVLHRDLSGPDAKKIFRDEESIRVLMIGHPGHPKPVWAVLPGAADGLRPAPAADLDRSPLCGGGPVTG